ncbi:MAG: IS21 family transposase [Proteiniphilum sp.]|nr:IS21 family transposase [Proteiniphilum sp.]
MISMYTKQEIIISSYREGKSHRQIARDHQISRKTVKKYLQEHEKTLQSAVCIETAQASNLSVEPIYKMSTPRSKLKLTPEVEAAIDGLLADNEKKQQLGMRKQMLKKKDILEELQGQGFDIGYTTVCNHITHKENRQRYKEAYIRQVYQAGEICEFDWGEIKLCIAGKLRSLQLAVFTSAYSNYRYAFIYDRQDTLAFMESHVRFYQTIGGVYREMVYDNMRVAVAKFVGRHEKEPTQALLQLRGHYQFSHRFCNIYRGNEKGHVERSVEYVRRKAFAPKDYFADARQAQDWLEATLKRLNGTKQQGTGKSADELFLQEKRVLGKHPSTGLICSEQVQSRVDKYATISYRTNRYSVPDHLVGEFVDVSVRSRELQIYVQNKRVATHTRSYEKHYWSVEIEHYLSTFKKKPGALSGSLALADNHYLGGLYTDYFQNEPREFIELLTYCREQSVSEEKLEASVRRLLDTCRQGVSVEKLRALLGNKPCVNPIMESEDKISMKAKEQLVGITELMHQTKLQWILSINK